MRPAAQRLLMLSTVLSLPLMAAVQSSSRWLREQFLSPYSKEAASNEVPGNLVRHPIDDFGKCQFFAKRGIRWNQDFSDGSRLELRCDPDPGSLLPGYHLWY